MCLNLKSIALLGATQLPSWNIVFPLRSLKVTRLQFHSLLKKQLEQVLLAAEAAGISILQGRGSVVTDSCWGAAFCNGMLGKEEHPDISLDKCLSTCFAVTYSPFTCCLLTAFHPKQELCYIKIKATTTTKKGNICTSKTAGINAC